MLLATSLLGLACVAEAFAKTVVPGYEVPLTLKNQEVGSFTIDWSGAVYNPPSIGWVQRVAVLVKSTGLGSTTGLTANYLGSSYTATNQVDLINDQWYCAPFTGSGVEISFVAVSDQLSDGLGGSTYTAAGFVYQIETNGSNRDTDVDNINGWNVDACIGALGGFWQGPANTGSAIRADADAFTASWGDLAVSQGHMGWETIWRPAMKESFTMEWNAMLFGRSDDGVGNMQKNPTSIYAGRVSNGVAAEFAWNVATSVWVTRESSETGLGLYAKFKMDPSASLSTAFLCFQSDASATVFGTPSLTFGNAQVYEERFWSVNTNPTTFCDLGCYPQGDCDTYSTVRGSWNMENEQGLSQVNEFYAHVVIAEHTGLASVSSPNPRVAFAWGHLPDSATAFGPSALVGLAALYLTTQC